MTTVASVTAPRAIGVRPLEGSVAVVTGAGRGIGRAIAGALAQAGARVVLSARTRHELDEAVETIRGAGGTAVAIAADVARTAEVDALARDTISAFGAADLLVNNAGVQLTRKPFTEVTEAEWLAEFDVNVHGVFRCCRALLPAMVERGGGVVLNVA